MGGMMKSYITQVGLERHVHTINDINQISYRRTFTRPTIAENSLGKMKEAIYREVFEAFKAFKMLNIGINDAKVGKVYKIFQMMNSIEPQEDRTPMILEKKFTINIFRIFYRSIGRGTISNGNKTINTGEKFDKL
jgi:hypothetical protein